MKIQALIATMHQSDYTLLDRMNIQSDAIVINQCNKNDKKYFQYDGYDILWINTMERGLSRSRNMALKNASGDICILCDDDEVLSDGYLSMIRTAYDMVPGADVIAFNINRIGTNEKEKLFTKPKRIGYFKTYSSVHITFRRKRIAESEIVFDERFGTGSGMYACAEDAIFCMDCHKLGLAMYTYPGVLCDVNCEQSTWFTGYNEKYFYDVGAYLAAVYPYLKSILKWYYPYRCRKITMLKTFEIIGAINKGINGFKKKMGYDDYKSSTDA